MLTDIVSCQCHDCQRELDAIEQPTWDNRGSITLVTCWSPGCLLYGFTLSASQYAAFTETEWEPYRAMTRKNWAVRA